MGRLWSDKDEISITTLRMLCLDMVQRANSGHPGMPLGAAPMAYVLWKKFLRFDPKDPLWPDRDRFILSAGHGSALLYSLLHMFGYDISLEDLKNFRQMGSKTPGHPEINRELGIETTTGPLGQGFANSVGMAIAAKHLGARFNRKDYEIFSHNIYAIVSDGDLMEGVAQEAASLAGHLKLGNLIYLYDSNEITLAGESSLCFKEDIETSFVAKGWQVIKVNDGKDLEAIERAIESAKKERSKPSLIIVKTHIGYGTPLQDKFEVHGSPLNEEDEAKTREFYNWDRDNRFFIPSEVKDHLKDIVKERSKSKEQWDQLLKGYMKDYPKEAEEIDSFMKERIPGDIETILNKLELDGKAATRSTAGQVMNAISGKVNNLIGGSADLNPSTKTVIKDGGAFMSAPSGESSPQGVVKGPADYSGKNIIFGVREHAMGAIANGIAAHEGLIPFVSTFLVFSDYLRPAIRLAALSKLPVIFIFTHDSIGVGEDGPTHQPVEHVMSLRAIPQLAVFRPAEARETAQAWKLAIERKEGPSALILTRQKVPTLASGYSSTVTDGVRRGAYVIDQTARQSSPEIILAASGSEVSLIMEAAKALGKDGVNVRIISIPCFDIFKEQGSEYKRELFPENIPVLTVEAGITLGWDSPFAGRSDVIGIDTFGASAPGDEVFKKYGFTAQRVVEKARSMIKKKTK